MKDLFDIIDLTMLREAINDDSTIDKDDISEEEFDNKD